MEIEKESLIEYYKQFRKQNLLNNGGSAFLVLMWISLATIFPQPVPILLRYILISINIVFTIVVFWQMALKVPQTKPDAAIIVIVFLNAYICLGSFAILLTMGFTQYHLPWYFVIPLAVLFLFPGGILVCMYRKHPPKYKKNTQKSSKGIIILSTLGALAGVWVFRIFQFIEVDDALQWIIFNLFSGLFASLLTALFGLNQYYVRCYYRLCKEEGIEPDCQLPDNS